MAVDNGANVHKHINSFMYMTKCTMYMIKHTTKSVKLLTSGHIGILYKNAEQQMPKHQNAKQKLHFVLNIRSNHSRSVRGIIPKLYSRDKYKLPNKNIYSKPN